MIDKETIRNLLRRPISFNPAFAEIAGSVTAGLFLSQMFYWDGKGKDPDGWIFKTQAEWELETTLTRREQDTARRQLRGIGVLEEKLKGVPATMHYRINEDRLYELLCTNASNKIGGNVHSSLAESAKLEWRKAPNCDGGKRQTITETTHKTTGTDYAQEKGDKQPSVVTRDVRTPARGDIPNPRVNEENDPQLAMDQQDNPSPPSMQKMDEQQQSAKEVNDTLKNGGEASKHSVFSNKPLTGAAPKLTLEVTRVSKSQDKPKSPSGMKSFPDQNLAPEVKNAGYKTLTPEERIKGLIEQEDVDPERDALKWFRQAYTRALGVLPVILNYGRAAKELKALVVQQGGEECKRRAERFFTSHSQARYGYEYGDFIKAFGMYGPRYSPGSQNGGGGVKKSFAEERRQREWEVLREGERLQREYEEGLDDL